MSILHATLASNSRSLRRESLLVRLACNAHLHEEKDKKEKEKAELKSSEPKSPQAAPNTPSLPDIAAQLLVRALFAISYKQKQCIT